MAQWFQAISDIPNKTIRANKKTVNEVYLFDSVSYRRRQNLRIYGSNWPDFQLISIKRLKCRTFFVENGRALVSTKVQYITFDEVLR
jgi:hypothetical protein